MVVELSRDEIVNSLRSFKSRRDDLLHEDVASFNHHLDRFVDFCRRDPLVQRVLSSAKGQGEVVTETWWKEACVRRGTLTFPPNADQELLLRFTTLEDLLREPDRVYQFGLAQGGQKRDDYIALFRSIVVRPLAEELTHRLGNAADLASSEARALQAVPLNRIPSAKETRIFLSHKSVDKPLVYRYYHALKEIGFAPWLDEPSMAAGAELEREVLRGFEESCAAVFFITESFKDEKYLGAEVQYAILEKRKKEKKFAIITLRYSNAAPVPGLLKPYVYRDIENDLEGFHELVRALPIELGPIRWKAEIVG